MPSGRRHRIVGCRNAPSSQQETTAKHFTHHHHHHKSLISSPEMFLNNQDHEVNIQSRVKRCLESNGYEEFITTFDTKWWQWNLILWVSICEAGRPYSGTKTRKPENKD
eukprot:scaffold1046_cov162-Ochromonas_danica.AAC.38